MSAATTKFYDPLLHELYEAGLQLNPLLEASDEPRFDDSDTEAVLAWLKRKNAMTEAERLRENAARIEARDAAIKRFRNAIAAIKTSPQTP